MAADAVKAWIRRAWRLCPGVWPRPNQLVAADDDGTKISCGIVCTLRLPRHRSEYADGVPAGFSHVSD